MSSEPLRSSVSGWRSLFHGALALAGGLGLAVAASAAPVTKTLPAIADTTLRQQQTNQNRGDDEQIRLGWAQGSRALVRFDQAAIAAAVGSGTLVSAHLELWVEGTGESWNGSQNVDAHRVTAAWTEAGATWNCAIDAKPSDNKADCNPPWNGGSFVAAATASVAHTKQSSGTVRFAVTADVAAFLSGTANQGWLLKKANEALSGRIDYTSREGTAAQRPRLVLVVEPGGAVDTTPPTVAITAPANGSLLATARPTVTAVWSDAGTGIDLATARLTVDGANRTAEATATATGLTFTPAAPLADGSHTAIVEVRDRAGNQGSATVGFRTDIEPPILAFSEPIDSVISDTLVPPISLSFIDIVAGANTASLTITLDGHDLRPGCFVDATSASCLPAPLSIGPHTAAAALLDAAGNRAIATIAFEIADLEPPFLSLFEPEDGGFVHTANLHVAGVAADDLGIASVVVNGIAATLTGGDFAVDLPLTPGSHRIDAVATDIAGKVTTASATVTLDLEPPSLAIESPRDGQPSNGSVRVAGLASDAVGLADVEVNGLSTPVVGDRFEISIPTVDGPNPIVIHALDRAGNVATASLTVIGVSPPSIAITAPTDLATLAATATDVSGTVGELANVSVNGISAEVTGGVYLARGVPLIEGGNLVTATATTADGRVSTATIQVVRDLQAPRVAIDAPVEGAHLFDDTVDVTGLINDIVAGTVNASEATVKVNGLAAQVSNRSFFAPAIPLSPGDNRIEVEAIDASGNVGRAEVTIRRETAGAHLKIMAGDRQMATISTDLAAPLAVAALDSDGHPLAHRVIVFTAEGNSGSFPGGRRMVAVTTDDSGFAAVSYTLGSRAGAQRIGAQSAGFAPVTFTATALPGDPALVVADDGSLQVGATGQPLPRPLVATVVDSGFNRLAGVPVRFQVRRGRGLLAGSASDLVVTTDSDGRAIVKLTLDPDEGIANNVVEARIDGVPGPAASFVASGRAAGDPAATTISGIVLDNSNLPIPGATLRILDTAISTRSDAQGAFRITGAPVGTLRLVVDGSTVERPGSWPDLEFVLTTISGRDNTVNMPIFLLPLDLASGVFVDETHGGTVALADFPGFALEVAPGSVTFPGGSRSGLISVTVVHGDKVPMVPNFGQQPRFIVTIQPAGARFDPPARLTLPNTDALAPGAVTELYSFDHDLGHFVSIGPATVSNDGRKIISNRGVGVIKAGWHCGGNPDTSGTCEDDGDDNSCGGNGLAACSDEEQFTVEITDPLDGRRYTLDPTSGMPPITAKARIVGPNPDPTLTTEFTWQPKLHLNTRDCSNYVNRSSAAVNNLANIELDYPTQPGTNEVREQRIVGGMFSLTLSHPMTGDLTLRATATIGNGTASDETRNVQILGRNPTMAEVQSELGNGLLRRLACHESRQRQFDALPGGTSKCPLFSQDRYGGVGIMQVTSNPSFEDQFDWRANIRHGRQVFNDKEQFVRDYPTDTPNRGIKGPEFSRWVTAYNLHCRTELSLPALRDVVVPALPSGGVNNPGDYERDWLRAYNGLCGPRFIRGPLHEYKLRELPSCRLDLDVDESTLVGTAKWVRVNPSERCGYCDVNSVNYAAEVMSFNPTTCAQGTPEIARPTCN